MPKDDGTDVPNEPSEEGRALGLQLAELVAKAEPLQRATFQDMLPMCNDCALRAGTLPNQSLATLLDVTKCAVESVPFFCHKGIQDGDQPKRLCTGAMVLMSTITAKRADERRARNERKRDRRARRRG